MKLGGTEAPAATWPWRCEPFDWAMVNHSNGIDSAMVFQLVRMVDDQWLILSDYQP